MDKRRITLKFHVNAFALTRSRTLLILRAGSAFAEFIVRSGILSRSVRVLSRESEREEFASEIMSDEITALLTAQSDIHGRMARSVHLIV